MRNRRKQRELHKLKEEKPDKKNSAGVYDPTPYYAVLRIRNKERAEKKKAGVA